MKITKKIISVVLAVCMLVSAFGIGASAEGTSIKTRADALDKDVPVVFVEGMCGEFYNNMSTPEKDDDVRVWGMETKVILEAVFKNIIPLLVNIVKQDYQAVSKVSKNVCEILFTDFACDTTGTPDPNTYKNDESDTELHDGYGYENYYHFVYDWRFDTSVQAAQLNDYIEFVMELTGSDKVALVAMSMGNSVLMTYLYEYYYKTNDGDHIDSVVFLASGGNGVAPCEDPFGGDINITEESFMLFLRDVLGSENPLYLILELIYTIGILTPVKNFLNNLIAQLVANGLNDSFVTTIGTIPGFYSLMRTERYEKVRDFIFDTDEKRSTYAEIIEKADYFHYNVQDNSTKIIQSLLDDGIKTGIFAQYGYSTVPLTSDNSRMADGMVLTSSASFGATCAEVDGTLGENYVQAKACPCGKNHVSADNQIDASTCAFPDITWFGKYLRHVDEDELVGDVIDTIIYSDEQISVHTYEDMPQYLILDENDNLVALTAENAEPVLPFEETLFFKWW